MSPWRRRLSFALFVALVASVLLVMAMGHQDLYRLFRREGEAVAVNWRFLGPLLAALGIASTLAILHADAIVAAARARRAPALLQAALVVCTAVGIGVVVNLISARRGTRWDLTHERAHSLSERTRKVLGTLEQPIEVDVLVTAESPWFATVSALCDGYQAAAGGQLEVRYLHPAVDPEAARARLATLGIVPDDLPDTRVLIVAQGGPPAEGARPRSRVIALSELVFAEPVEGPRAAPRGTARADEREAPAYRFRGEEALTRAVLAVSRPEPPVVAFTTGHRELDRAGASANRNLSGFVRALESLDYRIEALRFDAADEAPRIPDSIAVLVIAGARTPFTAAELEALRAWLERGGRLLVLDEPHLAAEAPGGAPLIESNRLSFVLEGYGILPDPRLLRDPEHSLPIGPWAFEAPLYGPRVPAHPITAPLARRRMWLRLTGARPLTLVEGRGRAGAAEVVAVAVAGPTANAVGAGPEAEETGPRPKGPWVLAAAARRPEAGGLESRVFVLGDATAASDLLATEGGRAGNLSLLVNAVGWLAEAESAVSISARTPRVVQIQLTTDDARRLWLLCLLELPGAFLLAGAVVWFIRR